MIIFSSVCTDGCVQMLLDSVDEMSANLTEDSYALINVKLKPPWHLLANTNENVTRIEEILKAYVLSSQHLLSRGFAAEEELKKRVKNSINKVSTVFFLFSIVFLSRFRLTLLYVAGKKNWKANSELESVD